MEEYWMGICSIPGVYQAQIDQLIRHFGNPKAAWEAKETEFKIWKEKEVKWIDDFLTFRKHHSIAGVCHRAREKGINFISRDNESFPEKLKNLTDCPAGLFYKGRLPNPEQYSVAIIGARQCSHYGKVMAQELSSAMTEAGAQVISGMAYGIDGYAQMASVSRGGDSFGILGCGVDICYPVENYSLYSMLQESGGLISEFPVGSQPQRIHFPMRNRIISGLSDVVVVVEARKKSGSLITADLALDQGKDVYAVPGRNGDVLSYGCNHLIEQGAGLVLSVESLLEHLNLLKKTEKNREETQKKKQLALAREENLLYSNLNLRPKSLQELSEKTDFSLPVLINALYELERKGLAAEISKNYYAKLK
ncbi:MAG: DNA-processing protein DprA [Lachnospiraceae bacterium]|nr:DNA-processing protein DprA [Lachnospiraceae bacterium]